MLSLAAQKAEKLAGLLSPATLLHPGSGTRTWARGVGKGDVLELKLPFDVLQHLSCSSSSGQHIEAASMATEQSKAHQRNWQKGITAGPAIAATAATTAAAHRQRQGRWRARGS